MPTQEYMPIANWFTGRWWAVLLRGLVAIAFGIAAFAWPGVTIKTLVLLFAIYALTDGVVSLAAAFSGRHHQDRWLLVLEGVIGLWAGLWMLRAPQMTAFFLVLFISIWAMATGFLRIVEAIRLRKEMSGELWLVLSGIVAVLFALTLMARPMVGLLALVWVIAGYALVMGIFLVLLSFELRRLRPAV